MKHAQGAGTTRAPGAGAAAATRALQTIDDVRRRLDAASPTEDLAALAADVHARLSSAFDALEASAARVIDDITRSEAVPRALRDEVAEAERRIRESPLAAVLVAAGIGLVAGLILRRR
jgi:ElaB/YqjD/DUF883 family membrane-anchored ribosome-binding protein